MFVEPIKHRQSEARRAAMFVKNANHRQSDSTNMATLRVSDCHGFSGCPGVCGSTNMAVLRTSELQAMNQFCIVRQQGMPRYILQYELRHC